MEPVDRKETQECTFLQQPNVSLRDIEDTVAVVPRSIGLGVSRDYDLDREVPDALREIYLNWKEAIIREHKLPLQDFIPYIAKTNDRNEIMILVEGKDIPRPLEEHQPEPKIFGYIRFVISQGKAEFINFESSFDDQCLNLGRTAKTEDNCLRGLQIAALILCRENHHLRISANGCHWNFGFNSQACLYSRATPSKAKREMSIEGKPLKLCADIHEDVAVTIGHKGKPLSLEDFQVWLRDTIDLHETPGRIRTPSGDLLLDQYYQGRLYFRGIRVLQPVFEPGQAFRFGYNLARGTVGRDRQPLVNMEEIMACIHSIWERAIEQAGDVVLPKYLEIFQGTPPPADARGTDYLITETTAHKMWDSLIHNSAGAGVFYCLDSRRNDDYPIIRSELRKEPGTLPDSLWKIFRKYGLVRYPKEELYKLLQTSETVGLLETVFAYSVAHTLRALLRLDPRTEKTSISFVRCVSDAVDMAYRAEQDTLYIHEKWLWPHTTCQGAEQLAVPEPDVFVWQHTVEVLYHRLLAVILNESEGRRAGQNARHLLRLAHHKLHFMPRNIQVALKDEKSLTVSFYTGHSLLFVEQYGVYVHYLVILHRPNCEVRTNNLIYNSTKDTCACPRKAVSLASRTARFSGLNSGTWTPTVVRMRGRDNIAQDGSSASGLKALDGELIGIPPGAVSLLPSANTSHTVKADDCDALLSSHPTESDNDRTVAIAATERTVADAAPVAPKIDGTQERMIVSRNVSPQPPGDIGHVAAVEGNSCAASNGTLFSESNHSPEDTILWNPLDSGALMGGPEETFAKARETNDRLTTHEITEDVLGGANARHSSPLPTCPHPAAGVGNLEACQLYDNGQQLCEVAYHSSSHISTKTRPLQPGMNYPELSRGTFAKVELKSANAQCYNTVHYIIYIHDIVRPFPETALSPKLMVTKYSFIADHLNFSAESPIEKKKELVLHFRTLDKMGEESDSEFICINDIVSADTEQDRWSVSHDFQKPSPGSGFYARYAIQRDDQPLSLFMTALKPTLSNHSGTYRPPNFSPLPVAVVIDFSPEDLRMSSGFKEAGYRIGAAIGYDTQCYQPWKNLHPEASMNLGSPSSIILDIESGNLRLPELGSSSNPRIGIFSIWKEPQVTPSPGPDAPNLLEDYETIFRWCRLTAQSSSLNFDFIVLTSFQPTADKVFSTLLADTVAVLLEQGYSVTVRSIVLDYREEKKESHVLLLFAAPCGTIPQWIDETLSDLQLTSLDGSSVLGNNMESTTTAETQCLVNSGSVTDAAHPEDKADHDQATMRHGSLPIPDIAYQADRTGDDCQPCTRPCMTLDPIPRLTRNIATIVTRVIGELSKDSQRPDECTANIRPEDDSENAKRLRL
ncbi:hypothetical protein CBS11350_7460 [Aspergillus niger]|nr:hypothetical protein CBS11350_7460 [Aspergillus niger]